MQTRGAGMRWREEYGPGVLVRAGGRCGERVADTETKGGVREKPGVRRSLGEKSCRAVAGRGKERGGGPGPRSPPVGSGSQESGGPA